MQARHQKTNLKKSFPFRLSNISGLHFPPHWHDDVEIINVIGGKIRVMVNKHFINLDEGDIIIIAGGDVHAFMSRQIPNRNY